VLNGGLGDDTFIFMTGYGQDRISNMYGSDHDVIQLSLGAAFDTYAEVMSKATLSGINTILTFSATDILTIVAIKPSELTVDDFIFI